MRVHFVLACLFTLLVSSLALEATPEAGSLQNDIAVLLRGSSAANQQADSKQSASSSGSSDLAAALSNMLKQQQTQNQESFKSLFVNQKRHAKIDEELASQRKKVHEHAVFLEKLQMCLNEGPAAKRLEQERNALELARSSFLAKEKKYTAEHDEIGKKSEESREHARLSAEKNRKLKLLIEEEKKKISLLESKGAVSLDQSKMLNQAELELQKRLREVEQKEDQLRNKHGELKDLVKHVKDQKMRFQEIRESHREILAANNQDKCNQYKDCALCAQASECAWCPASKLAAAPGKCMYHNVNAKADGLTAGQCSIERWGSRVNDHATAMTFNVFGYDSTDAEQRAQSIFNVIIAANYPDFVAFQEISSWYYERLMQQSFVQNYYHVSTFRGGFANNAPAGLLILSRFNIANTRFLQHASSNDKELSQRPRVLIVDTQIANRKVTIGTASFSWSSAASRVRALTFIDDITKSEENFIMMGDFNFDDGAQPETDSIPVHWMDLWTKIHPVGQSIPRGPNQSGHTWDPANNWYAYNTDPASQPSRIDRIFLRSPYFQPTDIWLVGCANPDYLCQSTPDNGPKAKKTPKQLNPSNHFGLLATFSIFTPFCPGS